MFGFTALIPNISGVGPALGSGASIEAGDSSSGSGGTSFPSGSIVQSKAGATGATSITLDAAPTPGNTLVTFHSNNGNTTYVRAGTGRDFTQIQAELSYNQLAIWNRIVQSGDSATITTDIAEDGFIVVELAGSIEYVSGSVSAVVSLSSTQPTASPNGAFVFAYALNYPTGVPSISSPWTQLLGLSNYDGNSNNFGLARQTSSGTALTATWTASGGTNNLSGMLAFQLASTSASGTASTTDAADTSAGSGGVAVSGSGSVTESSDSSGGIGSVGLSGAGSATDSSDSSSGAGAIAVQGSGTTTEGTDSSSGSGSASSGASGSGTTSDAADSSSGVGGVAVSGGGAASDAADNSTGSGSLTLAGAGAATEGADVSAASGAIGLQGAGASSDAADTSAGSGKLGVSGVSASTEQADTSAGSGVAGNGGVGAATDAGDTSAGSGGVSLSGSSSRTDGADSSAGAGTVGVQGAGAASEAGDSSASAGAIAVSGAGTASDGADASGGVGAATGYVNPLKRIALQSSITRGLSLGSAVAFSASSGSAVVRRVALDSPPQHPQTSSAVAQRIGATSNL